MLHIFHLEDEKHLCDILNIALRTSDAQIDLVQFGDSDEGLAYVQQYVDRIDLYVLDIRVAGSLTGLQMAQKIRELGTKAPIMVTSAFQLPRTPDLAALDFVWMAKPWRVPELRDKAIALAKGFSAARAGNAPAEPPKPAEPIPAPADIFTRETAVPASMTSAAAVPTSNTPASAPAASTTPPPTTPAAPLPNYLTPPAKPSAEELAAAAKKLDSAEGTPPRLSTEEMAVLGKKRDSTDATPAAPAVAVPPASASAPTVPSIPTAPAMPNVPKPDEPPADTAKPDAPKPETR
jgi:hypothetical protein